MKQSRFHSVVFNWLNFVFSCYHLYCIIYSCRVWILVYHLSNDHNVCLNVVDSLINLCITIHPISFLDRMMRNNYVEINKTIPFVVNNLFYSLPSFRCFLFAGDLRGPETVGRGVEVTSRYGAWSCAYMVTSEEGKTAVCCFYGGSFLYHSESQVLIQRRIYTIASPHVCL